MSAGIYPNEGGGEPTTGHQLVHTRVVGNCDQAGLGRVMVQIPWIEAPVAAQVAVVTAGNGRGTFFIPQVGDDVLVLIGAAPEQAAYVIGSLWTSQDVPPRRDPNAAAQVQVIRTSCGHEVELDDLNQSVTITTANKQSVKLSSAGILLRTQEKEGGASLELTAAGEVIIKGKSLLIDVDSTLDLQGGTIGLDADGVCKIKGATVRINDP